LSDFLRIERRSYVIVDGFLGQHVSAESEVVQGRTSYCVIMPAAM
jgi:hypothetical protein